jgi:hypothetical protein
MMAGADRMTATARADIGARYSSPTVKRGSEVGVAEPLIAQKPPTLMPLISVPSQVLSGRQDENALDPLVEVGSKVPNVPGQEMCGMSFDRSQ